MCLLQNIKKQKLLRNEDIKNILREKKIIDKRNRSEKINK